MVWGILTFGVGVVYGLLRPGRENKWLLFKTGLLIGLILALVFALIGFFPDVDPLGFGTTVLGLFVTVLVLTVLFVLGAWVGDLIEGVARRRTA